MSNPFISWDIIRVLTHYQLLLYTLMLPFNLYSVLVDPANPLRVQLATALSKNSDSTYQFQHTRGKSVTPEPFYPLSTPTQSSVLLNASINAYTYGL
jgi:hypothetical protein